MAANPPNPPPAQPQPRVYPAVYSGIGVNNFLSDVLTLLRAVDLSSCIPTSSSTRSLLRDARPWSVCRTPSRSALHSSPKPDQGALFSQYTYFEALYPLLYVTFAMGSVLLAEKCVRSCYPMSRLLADLKLALDACVFLYDTRCATWFYLDCPTTLLIVPSAHSFARSTNA